ncbi:hypothetical protein D8674_003244 [Pyrus ussuriensis x Pyrus communis]|uniref:Uncharacterized protein n=1 Tax=Pyrus ussuriensis x Pyrus communis TaxID=2448454 RepID=A0A5N5FGI2_9ROSA|nr:hypothetical protein D8674_003244 [Pyrus ussuriensis x Pyrus communis]
MRFLNVLLAVLAVVFLMSMDLHVASAGRMWHDEKENLKTITIVNKNIVLMDSKQRGNTPPSGPNPPIPRYADLADTTINQRNFAGHTTTTPPPPHDAYPKRKFAGHTTTTPPPPHDAYPNNARGAPPPHGSNPTTPGSDGLADTTINQRNFAGHTTTTPPPPHDAYPKNAVARSLLAVATNR